MKLTELLNEMKKPDWRGALRKKQDEYIDSPEKKKINELYYKIGKLKDFFEKELDKLRPGRVGSGNTQKQERVYDELNKLRSEISSIKQEIIDMEKKAFDEAKFDRILNKLISIDKKRSKFIKYFAPISSRGEYYQDIKKQKRVIPHILNT